MTYVFCERCGAVDGLVCHNCIKQFNGLCLNCVAYGGMNNMCLNCDENCDECIDTTYDLQEIIAAKYKSAMGYVLKELLSIFYT